MLLEEYLLTGSLAWRPREGWPLEIEGCSSMDWAVGTVACVCVTPRRIRLFAASVVACVSRFFARPREPFTVAVLVERATTKY